MFPILASSVKVEFASFLLNYQNTAD